MQATIIQHTAALLLLTLFSITGKAQDIWTLDRCIEYAWANNLSIRQQSIEVSRSENQLLQDKLDFIPGVNASLGHNFNWGRSVDLQNLEIIRKNLIFPRFILNINTREVPVWEPCPVATVSFPGPL